MPQRVSGLQVTLAPTMPRSSTSPPCVAVPTRHTSSSTHFSINTHIVFCSLSSPRLISGIFSSFQLAGRETHFSPAWSPSLLQHPVEWVVSSSMQLLWQNMAREAWRWTTRPPYPSNESGKFSLYDCSGSLEKCLWWVKSSASYERWRKAGVGLRVMFVVQRQVLHFYRRALREASSKPEEQRKLVESYARREIERWRSCGHIMALLPALNNARLSALIISAFILFGAWLYGLKVVTVLQARTGRSEELSAHWAPPEKRHQAARLTEAERFQKPSLTVPDTQYALFR